MPASDCEVRDPRIRRTRQMLQSALLTLMQSRAFDEIAVQDIAEAATVNRATFYDHYTDKYDLLRATIAGGFHQLLAERNVSFDGTCPSAALAIILAACDFLVQGHAEGRCNKQSAFAPLVDEAITTAIRRVLAAGMAPGAGPFHGRADARHRRQRRNLQRRQGVVSNAEASPGREDRSGDSEDGVALADSAGRRRGKRKVILRLKPRLP